MKNNKKILLHICCISCGAYVSKVLIEEGFEVDLFFYNPNIFPCEEYEKRLKTTRERADFLGLKLIEGEYDHKKWLDMIKGLEAEPERGFRCSFCYYDRLQKSAKFAKENNYKIFTTTLTISPHKDAKRILAYGEKLAKEYGVEFLARDFKKKNGFKKSVELSQKLNLYRQNYCGCEFSRR